MYTMRALRSSDGKSGGGPAPPDPPPADMVMPYPPDPAPAIALTIEAGPPFASQGISLRYDALAEMGEGVHVRSAERLVGAEAHHLDLLRGEARDAPRAVELGIARQDHLSVAGRALELLGDERGAGGADRRGAARAARAHLGHLHATRPTVESRTFGGE